MLKHRRENKIIHVLHCWRCSSYSTPNRYELKEGGALCGFCGDKNPLGSLVRLPGTYELGLCKGRARSGGREINPQIEAAVISACVATAVAAVGWFITNQLTRRREEEGRRQQAALKHLERQIEALYGPLLGLIQQSDAVFKVAQQRRDLKDPDSEGAWNYFIEKYFLPLNAQMMTLLSTKVHLSNADNWPSYLAFFTHQAQFESLHRIWVEQHIDSHLIKGEGWPQQFGLDVRNTLDELRARHSHYLRKLGAI
jgi:hypothetical protein